MSNTVPPSGKATIDALADHWGKLFAIYLYSHGINEVVVTSSEIQKMMDDISEPTILVQELKDGIHIKILSKQAAIEEASKHKSGFGKS